MSDFQERRRKRNEELIRKIRQKEDRKARGRRKSGLMFGLGMFGLVGWSVSIPTLLGIALGIWMDKTWPGAHSWTLTMLFAGIILGCLNAWYWVRNALYRKK